MKRALLVLVACAGFFSASSGLAQVDYDDCECGWGAHQCFACCDGVSFYNEAQINVELDDCIDSSHSDHSECYSQAETDHTACIGAPGANVQQCDDNFQAAKDACDDTYDYQYAFCYVSYYEAIWEDTMGWSLCYSACSPAACI